VKKHKLSWEPNESDAVLKIKKTT